MPPIPPTSWFLHLNVPRTFIRVAESFSHASISTNFPTQSNWTNLTVFGIEAEKFNHNLTLPFGLLASDCKDEEDYLNQASDLVSRFRVQDEKKTRDVFFGELPDIKSLHLTLDRIAENIDRIRKIPPEQRHYDF